jgi:hypothetical protein
MDEKDEKEDDPLIKAMIANGDIIENDGNLWELELPTVSVSGKTASQVIEEDRDYLDKLAQTLKSLRDVGK